MTLMTVGEVLIWHKHEVSNFHASQGEALPRKLQITDLCFVGNKNSKNYRSDTSSNQHIIKPPHQHTNTPTHQHTNTYHYNIMLLSYTSIIITHNILIHRFYKMVTTHYLLTYTLDTRDPIGSKKHLVEV